MNIINTYNLFVSSFQQQQRLEALSNNALRAGIDSYQKEDYKAAAQAFKRAVDLAPQSSFSAASSNYLAMSYLKLEDTDKAIEAYKRWIKLNADQADPHIKLGNLYFYQKKYKEAEKEYAEAVRIDPNANNRYSLGQAYLFQDRYSAAEAEFSEVRRLEPEKPNGYHGLGLSYSRQGRYEKAIGVFESAIRIQGDFYQAYAEIGYAYTDLGRMDEAEKVSQFLERVEPSLADTLSRYMYKTDPPKIMFSTIQGTFPKTLGRMTLLSALDSYLANAGASKTFTMEFQFDKEMDRASVQDPLNWRIKRALGNGGPGEAYNFGLTVASTEVTPASIPISVSYDADLMRATVRFTIQQNESGDGTIDPSHIEFKFLGEDAWGLSMDPDKDQFTGFSGAF